MVIGDDEPTLRPPWKFQIRTGRKIDHSFHINLIDQANLTCIIEPDGSIVQKWRFRLNW